MDRCPKCRRFCVEWDSYTRNYRCLWNDCLWVNEGIKDFTKVIDFFPYKFKKFIKYIEEKINKENKL